MSPFNDFQTIEITVKTQIPSSMSRIPKFQTSAMALVGQVVRWKRQEKTVAITPQLNQESSFIPKRDGPNDDKHDGPLGPKKYKQISMEI